MKFKSINLVTPLYIELRWIGESLGTLLLVLFTLLSTVLVALRLLLLFLALFFWVCCCDSFAM